MTFKDIVDLWRALPRFPGTGLPINSSVAMKNFHRTLFSPDQRGWFKACHAWIKNGPAPDQYPEIDAILKSLAPYHRRVAQAHLEGARLARQPLNQSFDSEVAAAATRWDLHKESLAELVNEIRLGRPRQTVGIPVYITYPVVSIKNNVAMLARFVLERLNAEENPEGLQGRLFPAPAQLFSIELDQEFQSTFNTAREITSAQAALPSPEDIRVSIELLGQAPLPESISINGPSGGCALTLGVAKIRTYSNDHAEQIASKLRTLEFNSIAATAKLGPQGELISVGGVGYKSLEILKTREAEIHEINVLIVAKDQSGFGDTVDKDPTPKCFLWPQGNSHPIDLASGVELRSSRSLLVIRAEDFSDAIDTLYKLHINTILDVLEKPQFILAYLLAGYRWSIPAFLMLMFTGWVLLPGFWFVLPGSASILVAVVWVYSKIRKVRQQSEFCLQQREQSHSPETWAAMVATLQSYQSTRTVMNVCNWFKRSLTRSSERRLTLRRLPWIWYRTTSFWIHLFVLVFVLMWLLTPLQHCLAEAVFPGTAKILAGESRRGSGNNIKYAAARPACGFKGCSITMTVGSYGLLRLFLEHKNRTARFLRVTRIDTMSYVKVDDASAPATELTVPVIHDQAKFYYGIDENTPWKIELQVEVLCYCDRRLEKLLIIGHRTPPGE